MNKIITGKSFNDLYYKLCDNLYKAPDFRTKPRGETIKEFINCTLVLENPRNRLLTIPERNLSFKYLAGELAFYFAGSNRLSFIEHYSKFWKKVSDDGKTVNSCYGKKLLHDKNRRKITQFDHALMQLLKDKDSRKAVMVIFDKHSADLNTKDNPCTMHLQFFIRKNKLHLTAYMRSCDIWFGLSYDLPFFTILQEGMLLYLKTKYKELELGSYMHHAGSLHVYEKDFEKVTKLFCSENRTTKLGKIANMTEDSLKLMPNFLANEKLKRCPGSKVWHTELKDPFLKTLEGWLDGK
jgi:thymidylate synthase